MTPDIRETTNGYGRVTYIPVIVSDEGYVIQLRRGHGYGWVTITPGYWADDKSAIKLSGSGLKRKKKAQRLARKHHETMLSATWSPIE